MLHLITCHKRIMPHLAELLLIIYFFLRFNHQNVPESAGGGSINNCCTKPDL